MIEQIRHVRDRLLNIESDLKSALSEVFQNLPPCGSEELTPDILARELRHSSDPLVRALLDAENNDARSLANRVLAVSGFRVSASAAAEQFDVGLKREELSQAINQAEDGSGSSATTSTPASRPQTDAPSAASIIDTGDPRLVSFQKLAAEFGFQGERPPDLLYQAAVYIGRMIRDSDHYSRKATRRADLRAAAGHLDRFRKSLGRLDTATIVSAFVPLGARESILVDFVPTNGADQVGDHVTKTLIDPVPLRYIAFETLINELEVVYNALIALAEKERTRGPGRPVTPDPVLFGINCLAVLWPRYRTGPISSSRHHGEFGLLVDGFFERVRDLLAEEGNLMAKNVSSSAEDDDPSAEDDDPGERNIAVHRRLTPSLWNTALRRYLERRTKS